ncbi:MAG: DUF3822 family protein [Draconibacterium sp.]
MYDYLDESFRKENSSEYILSIHVSLNGFSFCVRGNDKKLLLFKHTSVKISNEQLLTRRFEEWLHEEELLQQKYRHTEILFFAKYFTLLPENFNNERSFADVGHLLFPVEIREHSVSAMEELNANLLFLLPDGFKKLLDKNFDSFTIRHAVEKMLGRNESEITQKQVRLLFNENDLFLLYFDENQLILCNVFSIKHANDAIYYTITALKQFRFTIKETPAFVAGKSVFLNDFMQLLTKYFDTVNHFIPVENKEEQIDQKMLSEHPCLFN